jgi:hypothetical protein
MPDKKKHKPQRAAAAAKTEKKVSPKTKPGLTDEELDKVVGGASLARRLGSE